MAKKLRHEFILLFVLFALCGGQEIIAQEDTFLELVSPELLKAGDLEVLWQNKLPIKKTENLEQLFLPVDYLDGETDNRIYALSNYNYLACLDKNTGKMMFSSSVAPVGFPVIGLDIYNGEIFSLAGNMLIQMDREFGTQRSSTHLDFGETCPVVRNSSYFYLGGVDKRVHVLRADDKVHIFAVAADIDSTITSVIADEKSVIFATKAGNVISFEADKPKRLWQFDAGDAVAGPIIKNADSLFFASSDAYVYKIDASRGKLDWKCASGAILKNAPRVTASMVYQNIGEKGLIAIDKNSGKILWQLTDGLDLLAESGQNAYVITKQNSIVVMDNKKAKQLCSVDVANVSRYISNTADSKIYIADEYGRIACLKPID